MCAGQTPSGAQARHDPARRPWPCPALTPRTLRQPVILNGCRGCANHWCGGIRGAAWCGGIRECGRRRRTSGPTSPRAAVRYPTVVPMSSGGQWCVEGGAGRLCRRGRRARRRRRHGHLTPRPYQKVSCNFLPETLQNSGHSGRDYDTFGWEVWLLPSRQVPWTHEMSWFRGKDEAPGGDGGAVPADDFTACSR